MHKYTILQLFHRQGTWNQFRLQNYIKILPFSSFCWIRSSALDGWKSPILSYKVSWLFIPKFDVHSKHQIQVLFYCKCKSNRTLTFFLTKLLWVELSWGELSWVELSCAELCWVELCLCWVVSSWVVLNGVVFSWVELCGIEWGTLSWVEFCWVVLSWVELCCVELKWVVLS